MAFFGLLMVLVIDYTRPDDILPFILSLRLYAIVPLVVFVASLFAVTRHQNGEIFRSPFGKLLVALFVSVTVSALAAIYRDRAWEFWQGTLGYLLLAFMVAKLCDDVAKIKWILRILIGVHVWLILQNPALLTDPTKRSYIMGTTFLGDGNDFSLSVVIALPMCLYLFQTSRSAFGKVICIFAAILMFGAIMGTQSRGGALGVVAVVFYLWTVAQKKGAGMVMIVAGLVIVLAVASDQYLSRMQTIAAPRDESAQSRLDAWAAGIGMANRRPLTGIGPGGFPIVFGNWYAHPGLPRMNAHSMYFQALGETGYPGFIILLWLLWIMFRDNQRLIKAVEHEKGEESADRRKLLVAITASLVGFGVSGAFLSALYYPHLYLLVGLFYAVRRICAEHRSGDTTALESTHGRRSARGHINQRRLSTTSKRRPFK